MKNKLNITETQVFGFEASFRGMRNPKNSWHLSDTTTLNCLKHDYNIEDIKPLMPYDTIEGVLLGEKDLKLAQTLIKAGSEHMKFMRMIQVWADMDMTRFFWSEFDTYKFNSKNSCSTMHKLLNPKNEITLDMFDYYEEDLDVVTDNIKRLNEIREEFLATKDFKTQCQLKRRAKTLLFDGFLQLRTVNTNYGELRNMVLQRNKHQLAPDWQNCFCAWVTTLPYAKELIFCGIEDEYERLKQKEN